VKNPPYYQNITSIHEFNSISLLLKMLPVENLFFIVFALHNTFACSRRIALRLQDLTVLFPAA
jgi:hypothetical protein